MSDTLVIERQAGLTEFMSSRADSVELTIEGMTCASVVAGRRWPFQRQRGVERPAAPALAASRQSGSPASRSDGTAGAFQARRSCRGRPLTHYGEP